MKSDKLNLGCGYFPKEGFVNVDIDPAAPADIIHDLEQKPWPFEDQSFSEIEIFHVLEHVADVHGTLSEIYRILKPGGRVHIKVPHSSRGFTHWDHKRGFDVTFPHYFLPKCSGGFTGLHFHCVSMRLKWSAFEHYKRQFAPGWLVSAQMMVGKIIDVFANMSPVLTSRIWCYWVGGFEEIAFVLEKK